MTGLLMLFSGKDKKVMQTSNKRGIKIFVVLALFILSGCAIGSYPSSQGAVKAAPYTYKGWVFMGMIHPKKQGPRALYLSKKHACEKGIGKAAVMILPGEKEIEAMKQQIEETNKEAAKEFKTPPTNPDSALKVLLKDRASYYIVETSCNKKERYLKYKTGGLINYKVKVYPNTIEERIYDYLCEKPK